MNQFRHTLKVSPENPTLSIIVDFHGTLVIMVETRNVTAKRSE